MSYEKKLWLLPTAILKMLPSMPQMIVTESSQWRGQSSGKQYKTYIYLERALNVTK